METLDSYFVKFMLQGKHSNEATLPFLIGQRTRGKMRGILFVRTSVRPCVHMSLYLTSSRPCLLITNGGDGLEDGSDGEGGLLGRKSKRFRHL